MKKTPVLVVKTFIPEHSKLEVDDLTPLQGATTCLGLCKRFSKWGVKDRKNYVFDMILDPSSYQFCQEL